MLAAAVAMLAVVAACGGGTSTMPPPTSQGQMLSVPLQLGTTGENPGPRIMVAFPSAVAFSMVFDTGSTGIRILPKALAGVPTSAYTDTMVGTSNVFGGDRVYYGTVGTANAGVRFGGVAAVTKPLNFQIVTVVCTGNVPSPLPTAAPSNCNDTTSNEESNNSGGFFGVRPRVLNDGLLDPLSQLPSPYGDGFIVSAYGTAPAVTVGATAANSTGFSTFSVPPATAADGSAYWASDELLPWCYTFTVPGATPTPQTCPTGGVLTDSGGLNARLNLAAAPPAGIPPQVIATLPPSTIVTATLAEPGAQMPSITWLLTTGMCTYVNAPQVFFAGSGPLSPTLKTTNGVVPFFANDILYDLRGGHFGFRAAKTTPPPFCD